MHSTVPENVAEHSLQVAWVAHALAVIENKFFGGNFDACKVGLAGAYHETGEVITGDMPTPIKYFSPEINSAYKKVEKMRKNESLILFRPNCSTNFSRLFSPRRKRKNW